MGLILTASLQSSAKNIGRFRIFKLKNTSAIEKGILTRPRGRLWLAKLRSQLSQKTLNMQPKENSRQRDKIKKCRYIQRTDKFLRASAKSL